MDRLSPYDPFFQIIPRAIGRLESLSIGRTWGGLQDITAHLSRPAPLLKRLSIGDNYQPVPRSDHVVTLTTAFFDGDLSSLHVLRVYHVRTELPWRNMVNLTSFTLGHAPPDEVSTKQLLDFFESTPQLREADLQFIALASSGQNGRLVSLRCLKSLIIRGGQPTSLFLDHLLIPVGADLRTQLESPHPRIEDHLPRSLDNLRNLHNFTQLHLHFDGCFSSVQFTGPNGEVHIISVSSGANTTESVLEFFARFDTSTVKQLEIIYRYALSEDILFQALLPMKNLRALTISLRKILHPLIRALDPDRNSSNVLICPNLEELHLNIGGNGVFDVENAVGMAVARASRGAKLKCVRVTTRGKFVPMDVSELGKHVPYVEHAPEDVDRVCDYSDSSDEEV